MAAKSTTPAAIGMVQGPLEACPALGYGMPYAVGKTFLAIFGMAVALKPG